MIIQRHFCGRILSEVEGSRSARCAPSDLPACRRLKYGGAQSHQNQANRGRKKGGREILRRWLRMTF
jgi:hypothetical protein